MFFSGLTSKILFFIIRWTKKIWTLKTFFCVYFSINVIEWICIVIKYNVQEIDKRVKCNDQNSLIFFFFATFVKFARTLEQTKTYGSEIIGFKEHVVKEPVYWNDLTLCDTATRYSDVGRNHILYFFFVPVRKIISVQEIYSDSLFQEYFPFYTCAILLWTLNMELRQNTNSISACSL